MGFLVTALPQMVDTSGGRGYTERTDNRGREVVRVKNLIRFMREVAPYRANILLVAILTLISAGLGLPMPLVVRYITDSLYNREPLSIPLVFGAIVGITALASLVGYGLGLSITLLGQRFKLDIRRKLYKHLQSLSLGYFEKHQTGKVVSNIINDVATVESLLTGGFVNMISDTVTLVAVLVIVFIMDWQLALIALSVYPIYIANYQFFKGSIKSNSRVIREERDVMLGDLHEKLVGVAVVKSYARERWEVGQFVGQTRTLLRLNVRQGVLGTGLWVIAEFIGALGTALMIWYGGRLVLSGQMTPGSLMAFITFIGGYLYGPTLRLIQMNELLARTNAALERIFYTLDTQPEITDAPDAYPLPDIQGEVVYDNVWFEYEPDQPVIKGLTIHVKPGQMVALVGQSGSGKTTLVNLLQRQYDVTSGAIRIDGHDLRHVTQDSLRKQMGVVIQESVLFNDTFMENIRYGRLEATDEEVMAAAEAANIRHVLEAQPKGFHTRYGEEGVKLSGGEKQRVAIARAILSDPKILILDEATSALDSETEALIQQALDRLMEGRTSFVIAHRLSTIVKANLIIVMQKGEIMEMGSHEELLAKGGMYAELYTQQFRIALEAQAAETAAQAMNQSTSIPQPAT